MAEQPGFTETPWPPLRNAIEMAMHQHRPYTTYGLSEADITDPLKLIGEMTKRVRIAVSFSAYAIYCLAQAAAAHPEVLTYRRGRGLITFRDADVATIIEKRFDGVRLPAGYTVRAAQTKSLAAINWELREAVRTDQGGTAQVQARRRIARMPWLVRRIVSWKMGRDPLMLQRYHGTIGLTNLQTPGFNSPLFGLPINICTLTLALGTVAPRTVWSAEGKPSERQIIYMAAGVDHMVVDGMGMSRFAHRMVQLLESCAGLDDAFVAETKELSGKGR